ncbi:MAG: DegT/DnrJ/EryC1/StrS family aminotransferase [Thermoproteota archaeon]
MEYALAHNTGTAALHSAMFGVGIGKGDEIICPSITYWASCLQVYSISGTFVF